MPSVKDHHFLSTCTCAASCNQGKTCHSRVTRHCSTAVLQEFYHTYKKESSCNTGWPYSCVSSLWVFEPMVTYIERLELSYWYTLSDHRKQIMYAFLKSVSHVWAYYVCKCLTRQPVKHFSYKGLPHMNSNIGSLSVCLQLLSSELVRHHSLYMFAFCVVTCSQLCTSLSNTVPLPSFVLGSIRCLSETGWRPTSCDGGEAWQSKDRET